MRIGPLGRGIELAVPYENQVGEVAGVSIIDPVAGKYSIIVRGSH